MLISKTDYNQLVKNSARHSHAVVHMTYADFATPNDIIRRLANSQNEVMLMDMQTLSETHYAFIGLNPMQTILSKNGRTTIKTQNTSSVTDENPFDLIKANQSNQPYYEAEACRLTHSAVGLLAYNAINYIENIKNQPKIGDDINDMTIYYFGIGIYFDYKTKTITFSQYIELGENLESNYKDAMKQLDNLYQQSQKANKKSVEKIQHNDNAFSTDIDDMTFAQKVNQAKDYIKQGEAFQIVLSRTFSTEFKSDTLALYDQLTQSNPSPYHFYVKNDNMTLVGASPEKLVQIKDQTIVSTPLAGTRKNTHDNLNAIIDDLNNDEKEKAEHMMLVDLARNDVGRVSSPGSVEVEKLTYPLILSNVIHLASDVTGKLKSPYTAIDALKASFPAGTLSGAPKIRAMELINQIEITSRGLYGGVLIALDHDDNLDSCIIIRNAVIKNNQAYVRSGCGVVFDSDPIAETLETNHKASAMIKAIQHCKQQG